MPEPHDKPETEFARQAEQRQAGLVSEFKAFLLYNKKWWLLPIIAVLLLVGMLVLMSSSAIAPFIYPFF
ncbi:MAG: DUF5989 family protein [Planctomycetota bacterium]|nr:DUF5989 family protein [Planctomycetota bacterium]